ncbi:MAG: GGDEF domain-containing phosphodiesterase [Lachnospiraceae bacterium]|nr:GGDEF domain-containing phosphodiesterase [Lachnospiraceae bacterium]
MEYFELLEEFLIKLNELDSHETERMTDVLGGICRYLGISLFCMNVYDNAGAEKRGDGRSLKYYDSKAESEQVLAIREDLDVIGVYVCHIYCETGRTLDKKAQKRARYIALTVMSYVSRKLFKDKASRLTYMDADGYYNLPYYRKKLHDYADEGKLSGKVGAYINLKHFSVVNRKVGRDNGDMVMRNYIKCLADTCGEDGIVARFGRDRFFLLFDSEDLDAVLEVLSGKEVSCESFFEGKIFVSASAGIYVLPKKYTLNHSADVIDKLVMALNAARTTKRKDLVFYNENMEFVRERSSLLYQLFPSALANEEFCVYYQPKVDVNRGRLVGAEALCRWSREGEIISPEEFIPLLEQDTSICKLDFYMLDRVCRDMSLWMEQGIEPVRVSVNMSRKHVLDSAFLRGILDTVDAYEIPHELIEIEFTETTTDAEFKDLKRIVAELQREDICVAVDDFGMGYSSLTLIKDIPWNVIKVDKSFLPVDEEKDDTVRSVMFRYVVAMIRSMAVECIVEGVETKEQVEKLKANDCILAQGYFYDKPLMKNEFEKRLVKKVYN